MSNPLKKDLESHLDRYTQESPDQEYSLFQFARWLQDTLGPRDVDSQTRREIPGHITRLSQNVRQIIKRTK